MRRYLLISGFFAIAIASCSSDSIVGPDDMVAFARAKALWDSRSYDDYFYEIRTFCFCPPELTRWNRVTVEDGEVTAVDPVEGNPPYTLSTSLLFQPIDSLFSQLHRAMSDGGFSSAYASIEVDYHETAGYPERIVYHAAPYVADAGSTIEIKYVHSFAVAEPARSSSLSLTPYSSGRK